MSREIKHKWDWDAYQVGWQCAKCHRVVKEAHRPPAEGCQPPMAKVDETAEVWVKLVLADMVRDLGKEWKSSPVLTDIMKEALICRRLVYYVMSQMPQTFEAYPGLSIVRDAARLAWKKAGLRKEVSEERG